MLRRRLRTAGDEFVSEADRLAEAAAALASRLRRLVSDLEPDTLGLYWPRHAEFNAAGVFAADVSAGLRLALPAARREPPRLEYRIWDGTPPRAADDHRIPTSDGPLVTPDVVLVPCVGFTRSGDRLGYGGGYFDRWLAAHPGVTAVGVAWSVTELGLGDFVREAHDVPLSLVVTEVGIVG